MSEILSKLFNEILGLTKSKTSGEGSGNEILNRIKSEQKKYEDAIYAHEKPLRDGLSLLLEAIELNGGKIVKTWNRFEGKKINIGAIYTIESVKLKVDLCLTKQQLKLGTVKQLLIKKSYKYLSFNDMYPY